ncbi:MAG TPA: hypothetical protein VMV77_17175 [Bacteroidales bacterium]|nr:hypothetical protein [Bacteroidales bacterium]
MVIKKNIKVPLYPVRLTIIFYDNITEVIKKCYLLKGQENWLAGQMAGVFVVSASGEYRRTIVLFKMNDPELTHGIIAHEAYHATVKILQIIGQTQDPNNNETEAYLINWITDQIYDLIKKNKEVLEIFRI